MPPQAKLIPHKRPVIYDQLPMTKTVWYVPGLKLSGIYPV